MSVLLPVLLKYPPRELSTWASVSRSGCTFSCVVFGVVAPEENVSFWSGDDMVVIGVAVPARWR